jgi:LacI family transcriptional regulator
MSQAVTLTDVAKAAGVSYVTVSRVLFGNTDYRRPTFAKRAARIRKLAMEMGYRPNAAARATVRGRFDTVGLLLSTHHSRSILPESMLDAISDALSQRGLRLSIDKLPDEKLVAEGVVPDLLRAWSVDGLLINYNSEIPARMVELVNAYGLPAVWLNSIQPHDCVYPDDEQAGRIATEHLLELGHKRIAFVHYGGWGHYSMVARRDGYEKAMRAAGLTPQVVNEPDMSQADRRRTAAQWLRQPDRPTAAVVYGVATLWPLNLAAQIDLGLKVPDDLSLVSFDNRAMRHADINVTIAQLPGETMAQRAVGMLLERIADPSTTHPPLCLPCRLERGNTTAPPKQADSTAAME